jgi:hypothetical protein
VNRVGNVGLCLVIIGAVDLLTYPDFLIGYALYGPNTPSAMLVLGVALLLMGVIAAVLESYYELDARDTLTEAGRAIAPLVLVGAPQPAQTPIHCAACGFPVVLGARFCAQCGRPLAAPGAAP